jgi:ATP-dependent DNA helicase RecQ
MARSYPRNEGEFSRISGVGEKKLREFGAPFMEAIAEHLATNPRQIFADDSFTGAPAAPVRSRLNDTSRESLARLRNGQSVPEIARQRGLTTSTIFSHLANAIEAGESVNLDQLLTAAEQEEIEEAFAKFGWDNIGGAREATGNKYDYGAFRIFRDARRRSGQTPGRQLFRQDSQD